MSRRKDDCLRQCVARVTGRKPSRVPHFVKKYRGRWSYHLSIWCKRTGHIMLLSSQRLLSRVTFAGATPKQCIVIGPSNRNPKVHHAIVVNHRGRVTYDGGQGIRRAHRVLVIAKSGEKR